MPDEFALLQAPQSPIQRAVLKSSVLPYRPSGVGVLCANRVEQVCVLEWAVVEGHEDVPGPFAIYQVADIVDASEEAITFRFHEDGVVFPLLPRPVRLPRGVVANRTTSSPTVFAVGHLILPQEEFATRWCYNGVVDDDPRGRAEVWCATSAPEIHHNCDVTSRSVPAVPHGLRPTPT